MPRKLDFEAFCPACGHLVENGIRKKREVRREFQCPKCTCKFSLTFEPINKEFRRRFELGEDLDSSEDVWG